jgi:signal transduction histidine kinase
MYSHTPIRSIDATDSFMVAHRRLRRVRWYWLLGALVLYAIVESAGSLILGELEVFVHDHLVDWSVAVLVAVGFTLGMRRWEDRWAAQIAALEMRRAAAEHALLRLEAAQTTVHTVAHSINLSLATIRGATELYREVPSTERNDADLAVVLAAVDQVTDQVHHLLEVSRDPSAPESA